MGKAGKALHYKGKSPALQSGLTLTWSKDQRFIASSRAS